MASKSQKKNIIRQDIIEAANIYAEHLAGRTFLYVYTGEFFEVTFPNSCFLHLTGVETYLSANEFYKKAKKDKLSTRQFYFTPRHPFSSAKKKLPCLKQLPELTTSMVCILKNIQTTTLVYKLGMTNLEFTLGLTENLDRNGVKRNDLFLPMSLRVETTSVEKCAEGEIVDFILSKNAKHEKYDTLLIQDESKEIPDCVHHLLHEKLLQQK